MKKQIPGQIQESVSGYLEQHPDADFQQLQLHFGSPETIAASYVNEMGTDVLLRDLRIRRKIVSVVAGVLAVALAAWLGAVGWAIAIEHIRSNGKIIDGGIGYYTQNTP